jgi:type II secretory pathway pseudopilin PulG
MFRSAHSSTRRALRAGFTLMQVLVTMSIGSIVISQAVPKVRDAERRSRANIIIADLHTFEAAFHAYAQEQGSWPGEVGAGVMPAEMTTRLGATSWRRVTPLGGQYNWDAEQMHGGQRYRAAITITETVTAPLMVDEEALLEIDRVLDDGNLSTGLFRTSVNYDPLYIIQQ